MKPDEQFQPDLNNAIKAIHSPWSLDGSVTGRRSSAIAWCRAFDDVPATLIDVDIEPDAQAVLKGMLEMTKREDRYGTNYIHISSDLYLFQIAADYHFHFVKHYLEQAGIYRFTGS